MYEALEFAIRSPSASARQRLPELANRLGFAVVQGNRMGHLLGADVSKGQALDALKQRNGGSPVRVLALGTRPMTSPSLKRVISPLLCLVRMVPIQFLLKLLLKAATS